MTFEALLREAMIIWKAKQDKRVPCKVIDIFTGKEK